MNIGVDLGGTKIRAGIELNGLITKQNTTFLQQKESLSSTIDQLIELIRPLISYSIQGIGIGVPSVVDTAKGIVYNVTNIESWKEVALKDILEKEFKLPTFVNNDVNCFTLGEHRFGLAKGFHSVVGITIGTGLGAGIIINEQLYVGHNCGAGEIGLLPYLDKNFEYYVSNSFFETQFGVSALANNEAAIDGNSKALDIWAEFGRHLGAVIKAIMYVYDPEVIILGGSISNAYPYFKDTVFESLNDFAFPESLKRLKIFQSKNKNIAILGAAALNS
ncbi:ROK family protein [Emticicia sp.]|uniref:ROK family protein n=1 Tax=Emticicia sp. TaxID=1930953 RepID=UPI003751B3F7